MRRWTVAAAAAFLAANSAAPALSQEQAPPPAAPAAAKPPFDRETAERLVLRAEENLHLHGLSLDPRYLAKALLDYRAVTSRLPADADEDFRFRAWFGLGFTLSRADLATAPEGIPDPARECHAALLKAAEIHSDFPGLLIAEGMLLKQRGALQEAVTNLSAGLEALDSRKGLAPRLDYQLRLLGHLARAQAYLALNQAKEHLALEDSQAAGKLAEAALRDPLVPPGNGLRRVVLTHLAAAYQRLDQFDNAARVLEWMIEDDPGNAAHCYNMGLIQANLQRFAEAVDFYRKAAHLDPTDPRPPIKIAYILLTQGNREKKLDPEEAARMGEVYLSLRRGAADGEYCALRAEVARLRKDLKEAERWSRAALEKDPLCRTALSVLSQILGRREDADEPKVREEIDALRKRLEDSVQREDSGVERTFC